MEIIELRYDLKSKYQNRKCSYGLAPKRNALWVKVSQRDSMDVMQIRLYSSHESEAWQIVFQDEGMRSLYLSNALYFVHLLGLFNAIHLLLGMQLPSGK